MVRQEVVAAVVGVFVLVLTVGCQQTDGSAGRRGPDLGAEPRQEAEVQTLPAHGIEAEPRCFPTSLAAERTADRLALIAAAVHAIRAGQCAVASPQDRVCRALFLVAATDPIAAVGAGLDAQQLQQVEVLHDWVAADGAEAAAAVHDDDLATAFTRLAVLDVSAALSVSAEAVVAIAIARVDPEILGPVTRAETDCA